MLTSLWCNITMFAADASLHWWEDVPFLYLLCLTKAFNIVERNVSCLTGIGPGKIVLVYSKVLKLYK